MAKQPLTTLASAALGNRRAIGEFANDVWAALGTRAKAVLALACAAAALLFWVAGRWFGIPRHPGFEPSLILQPSPAAVLLLTGFVLWICVALCTVIATRVRFDAGLFAACVGLATLSIRGGPMRYVIQNAMELGNGRSVFLGMIVELLVLFGFLSLAWFGLWALHRGGRLEGDALRDGLADREHSLGERVTAAAIQVVTMALLLLLLARVDDKKQVLIAVGLSSFLATLLAYTFSPVRPSVWFWAGPLFVGIVGYAAAYQNWGRGGPSFWKAGLGAGMLAPLGRPLPLDYASFGPAGAIFGYWVSRGWERAKELENAGAQTTDQPPAAATGPA